MNLAAEIERCRQRAASYFARTRWEAGSATYWRHSGLHDPASEPAHLLYGTWAGIQGSILLGGYDVVDQVARERLAAGLHRFQRPDGTFMLPERSGTAMDGHSEEYLAFHCTNYAWSALRALGQPLRFRPAFLDPYFEPSYLGRWLDARDLRRPWTEGNNVINLASFFAILSEGGTAGAKESLHRIRDWLDRRQDAETGLWHHPDGKGAAALEYAMAGGAHNAHCYYYLGMEVPRAKRVIDSCLRLRNLGVTSACVDLDMVDLLSHLRRCDYRRREVDQVLLRYLVELLQVQNPDGGFCDNYITPQRTFGLATPAGISVTWVTWFRLATIGMSACALLPQERGRWWFRNTIGSGYARPGIGTQAAGSDQRIHHDPEFDTPRAAWLAARREARWARRRLSLRVRGWMRGRI